MDAENLLVSSRILIVDDDNYLRKVLISQLRYEGVVDLEDAAKAGEAFDKVEQFKPDLILLDIQLPDGNGFDICTKLRGRGFEKPIILLTGQQEDTNIIKSLDTVANDYIAKPIRFGELLALIRVQLRKYKSSDDVSFTAQNIEFQPANKTLTALDSQRVVVLTEKETMILKKLFCIWPEATSKEMLLSELWDHQNMLATHTLETHIYRLRQKISRLTNDPIVETTQNGYRLVKPEAQN